MIDGDSLLAVVAYLFAGGVGFAAAYFLKAPRLRWRVVHLPTVDQVVITVFDHDGHEIASGSTQTKPLETVGRANLEVARLHPTRHGAPAFVRFQFPRSGLVHECRAHIGLVAVDDQIAFSAKFKPGDIVEMTHCNFSFPSKRLGIPDPELTS